MFRFSPALLLVAALACGSTQTGPTMAQVEYPVYSPEEAALFDDSAAPEIFGFGVAQDPSRDPKLAERTQRADSVVRAKIATVTSDALQEARVTMTLRPIEVLAGRPQSEPVEVDVAPENPSSPMIRSVGPSIVGRTLVLFFRRYNQDGEVVVHWRAEPDTEAVHAAVKQASALDEFKQ